MNRDDNGGPAFPVTNLANTSGMTLRDYFAAKALSGLMGRNWSTFQGSDSELIEVWARSAYGVADAMLRARETK